MNTGGQKHQTPYGTFELAPYPADPSGSIQAWSAADNLLLQEAHLQSAITSDILVVNDVHGALCLSLQPACLWTDSALSALALRHNERVNRREETPIVWSTQAPSTGSSCMVIMRIPKHRAYFEYQLSRLASHLPAGAVILAAGMDKHLSPRTADTLEQYIGPTRRHRGEKKARLFSAQRDDRPAQQTPETHGYLCPFLKEELEGLPNVFSRDKLDLGSRFLLETMTQLAPVESLIDMACGNGVLGLSALSSGLAKNLLFCDESAMAIASARLNAKKMFPERQGNTHFYHGDGLKGYGGSSAQLILCNPPFHLGHTVDELAGKHLLRQCHHHLQPGGKLCLVANRHLNYLPLLKRHFSQVTTLASNAKFKVFLACSD